MDKIKTCSKCGHDMIISVNDGDCLSHETLYESNFIISSRVDEYFCLECGFIEKYVRNPKVFTDPKYKDMGIDERSNK